MLILSRKSGQSIVINDDIVITVTALDRGRVQLGIQAPGYVPIYRQEIFDRMVADGEVEPLESLSAVIPSASGSGKLHSFT
jgi:carbon storage regulator